MSSVEELEAKYDVKRHIIVVVIVAVVLLIVFVFTPLILNYFTGPSRTRDPSERLNDSFQLSLLLISLSYIF